MRQAVLRLRLLTVAGLVVATPLLAASSGSAESAASTTSASAIAAGLGQSCALTRAGSVKCWGSNDHDQLGDGSTRNRSTPVDVSGLTGGVRAIAAGVRHGCALASTGGVRCWGHSSFGTLGDGTTSRRFTPVAVSGLSSGVTAIAAGSDHSCALTSAGGVKCWGYNRFGALGDGTTSDRWSPVDVSGLSSGVTAIAAGGVRSCAVTTGGGVKCWGSRVGTTPVDVPGLVSGVASVAVGVAHACALTRAGGVKCWGDNEYGQLGDGTTSARSTPVDVAGLGGGVTAIAAGAGDSCALTGTGGVKCWGLNDFGQLGEGTTVNRSTPVDVSGLSRGVTAVAVGSFHSCALASAGAVKCWGSNGSGQLGDGTTANRRTPVGVKGFGALATLTVVSRSVTLTPAGVAPVELRCGVKARCQGVLTLTARGTTLGSRTFTIAASRKQKVRVKLTARGLNLVVRARRLPARVRITGGTRATGTITLRSRGGPA